MYIFSADDEDDDLGVDNGIRKDGHGPVMKQDDDVEDGPTKQDDDIEDGPIARFYPSGCTRRIR